MNYSQRKKEIEKRFQEIQNQLTNLNNQAMALNQELLRLQGEYRLVVELERDETRQTNEKKKERS